MKKIWVVDDSATVQIYIRVNLQKRGFIPVCFEDSSLALQAVKDSNELPDIIFTDINMPNLNGYSFCRAVKSNDRTKNIPVIFISSQDSEWDKKHADSCGASGYLIKPFPIQKMIEIIEKEYI